MSEDEFGLPAVEALGDTIGKPRHLIADRAYNYVTNDKFALPVLRVRNHPDGVLPIPLECTTGLEVTVTATMPQSHDEARPNGASIARR
ncbi:hypothetical protein ACFVKB_21545 [Rhodococcus sp. NPDC127530]|uniref:hypothetical protein n=1 Tax=unclassified Rhodococcus (in: high G+C Gram-positive bacteria) TaxID=192944 RepID=UPI00362D3C5A